MSDKKPIAMFSPYVSPEAVDRVAAVLQTPWIGQGTLVEDLERAVERALGVPNAVAVNGSSSALRLALAICGVGPGDEVVTTPMTCTATNHPILEQFAKPVFADIQPETGNIDPEDAKRRITPRTKAIVCAHWAGNPCDLDDLHRVAASRGLPVIEDASEAFGASYRGRPIGAISRFTAFSFQAVQIVTTGEGGLLTAPEARDAEAARIRRWFGIDRARRVPNAAGYYDMDIETVGYGYHLTNIAAAIGLANLSSWEDRRFRRKAFAARYREAFKDVAGAALMRADDDREPSYHFFAIRVERRDDFYRMMAGKGIQVSVVHGRNDAYSAFGGMRSDLPCLDLFSATHIGLPTHSRLSDEDVEAVILAVRSGW